MSHAAILVSVDCQRAKAIEQAVQYEMEPFDENGEFFKQGSRWDWWVIGGRYSNRLFGKNFIQVKDLDLKKYAEQRRSELAEVYKAAMTETDPFIRRLSGIEPGETLEDYCRDTSIHFYAFLRARQWHENERLGWFGGRAKTECEIAGRPEGKCLVSDPKTGARIIGWNTTEDDWSQNYHKRFIAQLPPESWLVVVDYHV